MAPQTDNPSLRPGVRNGGRARVGSTVLLAAALALTIVGTGGTVRAQPAAADAVSADQPATPVQPAQTQPASPPAAAAAPADAAQSADEAAKPVAEAVTPARSGEAILVTAKGPTHFTVEIADDPVERARGLMFRQTMARDHGMLFDFASDGPRQFWMKNTPLSLDIIFIAGNGEVVSIAQGTTPFSTDGIPSEKDARFVLEVNAGVAGEIGLAPGDRLLHRRVSP